LTTSGQDVTEKVWNVRRSGRDAHEQRNQQVYRVFVVTFAGGSGRWRGGFSAVAGVWGVLLFWFWLLNLPRATRMVLSRG
jgi:hypothetical protein